MKGEVEKIWKNETSDGRRYEVLQINGEKYSLWDDSHFDSLLEGQTLEFEYRESGDFKNITKIYDQNNPGNKDGNYADKRLKQIVKMSSLRSASRIMAGSEVPSTERAEKTIEAAQRFEKYITDDDLEE